MFIKNTFLQAKWFTSITNWEVLQCLRDQVCWLVHSTWQCACAHCFLSATISGHRKHGCGPPTLLIRLIWPLVISSCFWEWNQSCRFQESLKFRNNCWSSYKWFQNSVPVVIPAVAEVLDMLHKFGSGLLWRWQQKPTTTNQSGNSLIGPRMYPTKILPGIKSRLCSQSSWNIWCSIPITVYHPTSPKPISN